MELFLLYVWMKLSTLAILNGIAIFLSCTLGFVLFLAMSDYESLPKRSDYRNREEWEEACKRRADALALPHGVGRVLHRLKWIIAALIALFVVMPSQTQTAVLVAGHYALRMADSPEASKVMLVLRKKANEYLDEELKEVKK